MKNEIDNKKNWNLKKVDENFVKKLSEDCNIDEILARVLVNRDITSKEKAEIFLNPKRSDFHDPFLINDMKIAVDRIISALDKKEKITIYGDYDVDGVTSSALLVNFFRDINVDVDFYISNRHTEGYGLNNGAIDKIFEKNSSLIITVDCGITACSEIEYAIKKNIDVIITDHHEPKEVLPRAYAVIDNKIKSSNYPFTELAGVGVAFKLIQGISKQMNLKEEIFLKYLDLVCVGTISDMVPIVDENRVITNLGFKLLKQKRNPGIRVILSSSNTLEVDSNTISFKIAPVINACGRMSLATEALSLFTCLNDGDLKKISSNILSYNDMRKKIESEITTLVLKKIEDNNLSLNNIIVVTGNNWHHGVIGIVASKITNKYNKPCILLTNDDENPEIFRGSGRSIEGFNLHKALVSSSDLIDHFGGHALAVGLCVKFDNIEFLKNSLDKTALEQKISDIVPVLNIDSIIDLKYLNIEFVKNFNLLEPYGIGNERPVFCFENVVISSLRILSDGKHLKLSISSGNFKCDAIGFNLGYLGNSLSVGDTINLVGNLDINCFNNRESVQIGIIDIKCN